MPARNAVLYLPAQGGVEAALLRDLLAAADKAHSSGIAFDRILADAARWHREFPFPRRHLGALGPWGDDWLLLDTPEVFVFSDERLLVTRVELGSPGVWEFLGALNPLEVLRQYLNDRHRRKQDRDYRSAAEARQLGLENDLREIAVIRERLELAREHGIPEDALVPLVQRLLARPLAELGALQDRGVIDGARAEVRELPSD